MKVHSEKFQGAIEIKAEVRALDGGDFFWVVFCDGNVAGTPKGGKTIYVLHPENKQGGSASAHGAELAAAAAMTAMATELREAFALAEARFASREANTEAAEAATSRLNALTL